MKTTLDLPEELIRRLKLRALREKKKLKDAVADVLRAGLAVDAPAPKTHVSIVKDKKTGLLVIQCPHAAPSGQEMTSDRIADILNRQEAEWASESA